MARVLVLSLQLVRSVTDVFASSCHRRSLLPLLLPLPLPPLILLLLLLLLLLLQLHPLSQLLLLLCPVLFLSLLMMLHRRILCPLSSLPHLHQLWPSLLPLLSALLLLPFTRFTRSISLTPLLPRMVLAL